MKKFSRTLLEQLCTFMVLLDMLEEGRGKGGWGRGSLLIGP